MNKIFWFLVILCFVSAGLLYWLLKGTPANDHAPLSDKQFKSEQVESTVSGETTGDKQEKEAPGATPKAGEEIPEQIHDAAESEKSKSQHDDAHGKVAPVSPEAPPENEVTMLMGKQGPFFVQLASIPVEEWLRGTTDLSKFKNTSACKVSVAGKGNYVRVLAGPYPTRQVAVDEQKDRDPSGRESLIVGVQRCLP
jgi:cell division septation protein DedD